mmetsp:Transcript_89625/g.240389  ORF Transcript_89625/g.240389 Transcript_89625/m.240389 type:complete len:514 (+) Transcript_89625:36-1577(+)
MSLCWGPVARESPQRQRILTTEKDVKVAGNHAFHLEFKRLHETQGLFRGGLGVLAVEGKEEPSEESPPIPLVCSWQRKTGEGWVDIHGSTSGPVYSPSGEDIGTFVRVTAHTVEGGFGTAVAEIGPLWLDQGSRRQLAMVLSLGEAKFDVSVGDSAVEDVVLRVSTAAVDIEGLRDTALPRSYSFTDWAGQRLGFGRTEHVGYSEDSPKISLRPTDPLRMDITMADATYRLVAPDRRVRDLIYLTVQCFRTRALQHGGLARVVAENEILAARDQSQWLTQMLGAEACLREGERLADEVVSAAADLTATVAERDHVQRVLEKSLTSYSSRLSSADTTGTQLMYQPGAGAMFARVEKPGTRPSGESFNVDGGAGPSQDDLDSLINLRAEEKILTRKISTMDAQLNEQAREIEELRGKLRRQSVKQDDPVGTSGAGAAAQFRTGSPVFARPSPAFLTSTQYPAGAQAPFSGAGGYQPAYATQLPQHASVGLPLGQTVGPQHGVQYGSARPVLQRKG